MPGGDSCTVQYTQYISLYHLGAHFYWVGFMTCELHLNEVVENRIGVIDVQEEGMTGRSVDRTEDGHSIV